MIISEEVTRVFLLTSFGFFFKVSAKQTILDGSVQNIQIDNQLADAQMPVVLYLTPTLKTDASCHLPAIHFTSSKSNKSGSAAAAADNAEIYKHLMVTVRNLTLNLEEELIFKALRFAGITRSDDELEKIDESAYEAQRGALIASTTTARS